MFGRLGTFFMGFVLGGATVYMSLHYHVVQANDGMHLVPKLRSTFAESYVDVRNFGVEDWNEHRELALAVAQAGHGDMLRGVAVQPVLDAMNGFLNQLQSH